jgi:hypothetical protein
MLMKIGNKWYSTKTKFAWIPTKASTLHGTRFVWLENIFSIFSTGGKAVEFLGDFDREACQLKIADMLDSVDNRSHLKVVKDDK